MISALLLAYKFLFELLLMMTIKSNPMAPAVIVPLMLFAVAGLGYFSSCVLAIVEDTSAGCHAIEDWPGKEPRDWIFRIPTIAISGSAAALAGMGCARLTGDWGPLSWMAVAAVFPIVLLSILETGDPLLPISVPILRTIRWHLAAGLLFYFMSCTSLVGAGCIVAAMVGHWGGTAAAIPSVALASADNDAIYPHVRPLGLFSGTRQSRGRRRTRRRFCEVGLINMRRSSGRFALHSA